MYMYVDIPWQSALDKKNWHKHISVGCSSKGKLNAFLFRSLNTMVTAVEDIQARTNIFQIAVVMQLKV